MAWQNVNAQLIPDRTLGAENSKVTPQGVRDIIEGGARRGSNLVHSFTQFNVGNTQQVYFANPSGIALLSLSGVFSQENNQPLVEAQAWMVDEKDTVILTAEPYREKAPSSWAFSQSCKDISQ